MNKKTYQKFLRISVSGVGVEIVVVVVVSAVVAIVSVVVVVVSAVVVIVSVVISIILNTKFFLFKLKNAYLSQMLQLV